MYRMTSSVPWRDMSQSGLAAAPPISSSGFPYFGFIFLLSVCVYTVSLLYSFPSFIEPRII